MGASFFSKPLSQSECRIKITSQLLSESESRSLGHDLTQKIQTNKMAEAQHNADKHYLLPNNFWTNSASRKTVRKGRGGDFFERFTIWSDFVYSISLVTPLWLGGGNKSANKLSGKNSCLEIVGKFRTDSNVATLPVITIFVNLFKLVLRSRFPLHLENLIKYPGSCWQFWIFYLFRKVRLLFCRRELSKWMSYSKAAGN